MSTEDISHIFERLSSIDTKQATMETKQDSMLESLNQMKVGIGKRVEDQGIELAVLKNDVGSLTKLGWIVGGLLITGIVGAFLKTILIKQ